jgi:uncharacterized protein YndB with AHSA1/START domain
MIDTTLAPVCKTITVKASAERAFRVFTEQIDTWWPRSHHIGKSPMTKTLIEGHVGGRCYSEQADQTECDWGEVLAWDPPKRFVMAWKITPQWGYEPDLAKSSEVEVRFTPDGAGGTRVDLEHRYFERMGPGGDSMRTMVDGKMGWGELLVMFSERAEAA